jgi:hypothetical protein
MQRGHLATSIATLAAMSIFLGGSMGSVAETRESTEFIQRGQRTLIWGRLCSQTVCYIGVCLDILTKDGRPGTAKITVKASLRKKLEDMATGRYCAENRLLTYFMTMEVFVEPQEEDLFFKYKQWEGRD